jgi:hypothetical protein
MSDFIVRNWGNLASVAGLVFSILAFVFAKRASTAAREARDKSEMALLRIGDLMNQASYIIARWETRLSEKSRNNLLDGTAELRLMHGVLTKSAHGALAGTQKVRLTTAAQRVNSMFNEERGAAVKAAEVGDK